MELPAEKSMPLPPVTLNRSISPGASTTKVLATSQCAKAMKLLPVVTVAEPAKMVPMFAGGSIPSKATKSPAFSVKASVVSEPLSTWTNKLPTVEKAKLDATSTGSPSTMKMSSTVEFAM
jgi:hypothetical protein